MISVHREDLPMISRKTVKYNIILFCAAFLMLLFSFPGTAFSAPEQVINLRRVITDDKTYLEWDAVDSADYYEICYRYEMDRRYSLWGTSTEPRLYLDDKDLEEDYYKMKVRAVHKDASGNPEYGKYSKAEKINLPPVFNIRPEKITSSSITISWKCRGRGRNAKQFRIDLVYGDENYKTLYSTKPEMTISGLPAGSECFLDIDTVDNNDGKLSCDDIELSVYTLPDKPKDLKCNYYDGNKSAEIIYKASGSAKGIEYEVYDESGNKEQAKTVDNSYGLLYLKGLSKSRFHRIRIRYICECLGKTYYTDWSDSLWFSGGPTGIKAKKAGNTIRTSWKKVRGANSYTVYLSTEKNGDYKKITTVKSLKATLKKYGKKKISGKKTYYVLVTANKKAGKKTFRSESAPVKAKR